MTDHDIFLEFRKMKVSQRLNILTELWDEIKESKELAHEDKKEKNPIESFIQFS